ncbi:hypothetical protein EYR40_006653 [Pleurotus pulmonarius]|nr:hypothetical protein EYR40_006653 [Pleurotus pulmonarius]
MGFFGVLKSVFNFFCAPSTERPPDQHQQQHYQQQQQHQPNKWQQPVSHPAKPPPHHAQPPVQHAYPPAPTSPKPPASRPQKHEDQNQINQQNDFYLSLRAQANEEGDRMARCFEESQQAYTSGSKARAKELSNEGKNHKAVMEELNRQASEWIFTENNKDSMPGEVDLHGLYVKEAIAFTDRAIQEARSRGDSEIHLIVGKGLHSRSGAKIRPAVEDLMSKHQLKAALDPDNGGVLIVQLSAGGASPGRNRGLGADEISRRIEKDDEGFAAKRSLAASTHSKAAGPPNPFPFPKATRPTPYQIFHLPRNASQDDIKERYYELVRIYHPDTAIARYAVPPDLAHTRFQSITSAYEALRGKPVASGSHVDDGRWPTASAWRARQTKRRDIHTEGDDRWKDWIIFGGVSVTIAAFVFQMSLIRREAVRDLNMERSRRTRSQVAAVEEEKLAEG